MFYSAVALTLYNGLETRFGAFDMAVSVVYSVRGSRGGHRTGINMREDWFMTLEKLIVGNYRKNVTTVRVV